MRAYRKHTTFNKHAIQYLDIINAIQELHLKLIDIENFKKQLLEEEQKFENEDIDTEEKIKTQKLFEKYKERLDKNYEKYKYSFEKYMKMLEDDITYNYIVIDFGETPVYSQILNAIALESTLQSLNIEYDDIQSLVSHLYPINAKIIVDKLQERFNLGARAISLKIKRIEWIQNTSQSQIINFSWFVNMIMTSTNNIMTNEFYDKLIKI
jgi:Ni,Fe-hydrogenase I large subunit